MEDQMDNFYEIATIVLGCVVIAQYVAKKKIERLTQRMFYMLDRLAQKDWTIRSTSDGYMVTDEDGDKVFNVTDKSKRRG
jgi:hypothetical protein